jgi:hypothetical protein
VLIYKTLRTKYPCCKGRATFRATMYVPRERYGRSCPACGQRYDVERKTLKQTSDVRIDQLEWTRMASYPVKRERVPRKEAS